MHDRPPDYRLIYPWPLPHVGDHLHWRVRYEQRRRAIRAFGELLPALRATRFAHVVLIRVQGPRQKDLDSDNLRTCMKGLRDALKACGYIRDDSPAWAQFTYEEDDTRRALGPRVEVRITYGDEGCP